ncbi:MAG TPA: POT family MFS transporter [Sedimentisphaerales bacterium]|nr:POT family MFS transporter [Sedimentisphaerales bacterium]
MGKTKYLTAPLPSEKTPAGIPYILGNELGERFSFYGMRCILVFFMTHLLVNQAGKLAPMTEEQSLVWFHLFVSAVYFTPLIGALLSDIVLGKYRTILVFSILYCFGYGAMAFNHTRLGLGAGLILIAIGSGMIKPCVTANVGDQFGQKNKHLMARMYSWFYFAINLGAFASNLLIPELLDRYNATVAFGVPGILMVVATLTFWLGRKKFVHIPRGGFTFVKECFSGEGLKTIGKLAIIYLFVAPFWAMFDQMDSSWMLQAEKMNRMWLGHKWLSTQIVSVNPLMILILIPTFSYLIYPLINKVFPLTALRKIGIGLFVAGTPFVINALIEARIVQGESPSIGWLILAYVPLTSAEVMVSITCLEFSYTQAPKKMKSFIMAIFLLSISLGNAFTALVNEFIQNPDGTSKLEGPSYFWFFVIVMAVTAVLFIPIAARYKVKDHIQDEAQVE